VQIATANSITKQRFLDIRTRTEDICSSLKPEDTSIQPQLL